MIKGTSNMGRMTRRRIALAALAIGALGLGVPGTASAKTVRPQGGDVEDSSTFVLKGQTLRVVLRPGGSASTGYHWVLKREGTRPSLRLLSSHASRDGKRQVLRFKARRAGWTRFEFRYMPPGRGRRAARFAELNVAANRRVPRYGCHPKGSKTVVANSEVRVFRKRRSIFIPHAISSRTAVYYGCERAQNRAYPLDRASNSQETVRGNRYSHFRLRGTKVGYFVAQGCTLDAYSRGCDGASGRVRSNDLHSGATIRSTAVASSSNGPYPVDVTDLVMSPLGGLAWIEDDTGLDMAAVLRSDQPPAAGRRTAHDRGPLSRGSEDSFELRSLRFADGFVYWMRGGATFRAPLR
jgi:hypothetical protein